MALSTEYMTINSEDRMSCNKLLEQDICMVLSLATILVVLLFSSIQNLNAAVEECISYDLADKLITLTCDSWNPSQIYSSLNNTSAMKKENDGTWLLNSNLKIWHDAMFHVNSTDTKWLKINSTTPEDPYHIDVVGNMMINSVKISSWNTTSNNYTTTDGKIPRSSITVLPVASGKTDIFNSEIAYLGDGNTSRGQGLSYWAGDGSLIKNNTIHHMYYAFYSEQVGNITIENNTIHDDIKYGIDPHTGTHDMIIRNNRVYDNGHIGIICSLDCNNITIDGNTVSSNTNAGIMLSRNVQDSIVRNNKVQNENTGVSVSQSSSDQVYNNTISNTNNGIQVKLNSSNNTIDNNSIQNSKRCGIEVSQGSSKNTIVSNKLLNADSYGVCLVNSPSANTVSNNTIDAGGGYAVIARDSKSTDNVFKYNQLLNVSRSPVKLTNGTLTFINNTLR